MTDNVLHLTIYSDYLCPWCFNSFIRIQEIQNKWKEKVKVSWKSFMLVPEKKEQSRKAFHMYSQKWMSIAQSPHSGTFKEWPLDKEPPNWSLPALIAAKVAQTFGEPYLSAYQTSLLEGYFRDHLNISEKSVLLKIAENCGMEPEAFEKKYLDLKWEETVWEEHRQALEQGIQSIPTVVVNQEQALVGAHTLEEYEKIFQEYY